MKPEDIRANLNRPVRFTDPKLYLKDAEYILTGAVFRLGGQGFYYQAELTDRTTRHSVMYVGLENIEPLPEPTKGE